MQRLLRITRWLLTGAAIAIAFLFIVPLAIHLLGYDVSASKWPIVFWGGAAIVVAACLSVVALSLQVIVWIHGWLADNSN